MTAQSTSTGTRWWTPWSACARSCHAHHDVPWSRGGHTSVDGGRLLCARHHTVAHDPGYATTVQPDNKLSFHRRC